MPLFRRYVDPDDPTVLVARCSRPGRPLHGRYLLLLTRRQLVVTSETRLTHRPKLYLEAPVSALQAVTWTAHPGGPVVDLVLRTPATRERFLIQAVYPRQLRRFDAALGQIFRPPANGARRISLSPAGAY